MGGHDPIFQKLCRLSSLLFGMNRGGDGQDLHNAADKGNESLRQIPKRRSDAAERDISMSRSAAKLILYRSKERHTGG